MPEDAAVRVVVHGDVRAEFQEPAARVVVSTDDSNTTEHHFTLPAMASDASHDCHMTLRLPSNQQVHTAIPDSQEQPEQLSAWKHEVIIKL